MLHFRTALAREGSKLKINTFNGNCRKIDYFKGSFGMTVEKSFSFLEHKTRSEWFKRFSRLHSIIMSNQEASFRVALSQLFENHS